MKITRSQLKEIIREELGLLKEVTIKTKSGHKVELSSVGSQLKIHTHRGSIESMGQRNGMRSGCGRTIRTGLESGGEAGW